MQTLKRFIRRLSLLIAVILFGFLVMSAYYANELRIAHKQTPELLKSAVQTHGATLSAADLSPQRRHILLAIEDPGFMQHQGVDLTTPGAGVTTISQGLVKLLYFPEGFQPGIAKLRQTLIARYVFDPLVSKEAQLGLLLNIAYLGHQDGKAVRGFARAAEVYFDKSFVELTDQEFVALVAMLIGPNALKPETAAHNERVKRVTEYLSGQYQPVDLFDVEYNGRVTKNWVKKMLVKVLAALT